MHYYEMGFWYVSGYVVQRDGLTDTAFIPSVPGPATMLLPALGLINLREMSRRFKA